MSAEFYGLNSLKVLYKCNKRYMTSAALFVECMHFEYNLYLGMLPTFITEKIIHTIKWAIYN